MSNHTKNTPSRRNFLKKAALGAAAVTSAPYVMASAYEQTLWLKRDYKTTLFSPNDNIQLALIGSGIQGIYDTNAALGVAGVKLVAVCDLYSGRLDRAKELWGPDLFTTRDYREILSRPDIDAVIVATPDHIHLPKKEEAIQKPARNIKIS